MGFILFIVIFFLSILMIVLGAINKGPKGNRSGLWMFSFVSGIVVTSLLSLFIVLIFILAINSPAVKKTFGDSFKQSLSDGLHRGLATKELSIAEATKNINAAKQAIRYSKEALTEAPDAYFLKKDEKVMKKAEALEKTLEANQKPSSSPETKK